MIAITLALLAAAPLFEKYPGRGEVRSEGAPREPRLGLLAAIKDFSPDTRANVEVFIAAFQRAGVAGIVVDGDSAYGVGDQDSTLTELFSFLGDQGLPVYVIIGNSESRSSFNRSALAAFRKRPNVVSRGLAAILTIKNGKGEWQQVKPGVADPRARLVQHKLR